MSHIPIMPSPIRLGNVRTGSEAAQLHHFTRERNLQKAEKLLKQGVDVDCVNDQGQSPLFCTSLLGFTAMAKLLLHYGADPNHRCDDRSTPVHAAVFSCNTALLSELLEGGGDLRLHDDQGRTPRDWVEIGAQEHSVRMVSFIKSCMSFMRSLSESQSPGQRQSIMPTSPKTLLNSPSLLDFLKPVSDVVFNKKLPTMSSMSDTVQCFGYGKLCVEKPLMSVGFLASVPFISDSELLQAEDEALRFFSCGAFTKMTNYSWRGSRVTVKELQMDDTQPHSQQHNYHDLLVTELDFCCRLFHPHLLQLMAVSCSHNPQQNKLVYERVHVGSLYMLLYHWRAKFPVLQGSEVLSLILQVCEALLYLHHRSLVMRSLSSHSVLVVHPGVAKVTGFGFMVPSDCSPSSTLPIPAVLYNWAAPEVIRRKSCTRKADLYSVCALIQELYTDSVPWGYASPCLIKQVIDAGQALATDPDVPQPYHDLLLNGLQPRAQDRTCSLKDLRYTLRSDLRDLGQREVRREVCPLLAKSSVNQWNTEMSDTWYSEEEEEEEEGEMEELPSVVMLDSISGHISSIILNLRVSQELMQQVESSLERTEAKTMETTYFSVQTLDEPEGLAGQKQGEMVVWRALGPPSTSYTHTGAESYQSSGTFTSPAPTQNHHTEHNWASEVSAAVARVDLLSYAVVGSSNCEEVQEQQRPLMDVQRDTKLEQLFKSFSGVHSESEDSADFHSINHIFTSPNTRSEAKDQLRCVYAEQDDSDDSAGDYPQSPAEPSSIFYTPLHHVDNIHTIEEISQSSSDDGLDVTMEVCRSNVIAQTTFRECSSLPEDPKHIEAQSVPASAHTTWSSHMADIAELSSITCSPAQPQEWVEQNGAPPSPCSAHFPPCNSTPRSPHTFTGRGCGAPCREGCIPPLQSVKETSPWGSTESYSTARVERSDPVHGPMSGALHSPYEAIFPQENSHTPSLSNQESTTATSGIREGEEKRSHNHVEIPGGPSKRALCEDKQDDNEMMKNRERTAAVPVLIPARDEAVADDYDDVLIEEEEHEEPEDPEQCDELNNIPEKQQIQHDAGDNEQYSCDSAIFFEESKRAHSTLDDVLHDLLDNPEVQRTLRRATVTTDERTGSDQEVERTSGQSGRAARSIFEQWEEKEEVMKERDFSGGDASYGPMSREALISDVGTDGVVFA